MEKMAGEGRDGDATTAPRSRRRRGLAAVEAAEQAMELRVGGEGILGLGELAGAGEGGCRRGGNRGLAEGEERIGGGGGDGGWRKKKERKEEGEGWWASPFDTQEVCGVPSRPTRSEYRRTHVQDLPGGSPWRSRVTDLWFRLRINRMGRPSNSIAWLSSFTLACTARTRRCLLEHSTVRVQVGADSPRHRKPKPS
jgi:hypothetical protein